MQYKNINNATKWNVYTTSNDEFLPHFDILKDWIAKNGIKQALTLFQVTNLFETLKVELEATAVR